MLMTSPADLPNEVGLLEVILRARTGDRQARNDRAEIPLSALAFKAEMDELDVSEERQALV